jgi:hypothetical protein
MAVVAGDIAVAAVAVVVMEDRAHQETGAAINFP